MVILDCDGVVRSASWEGIFQAYVEICRFLQTNHILLFSNVREFRGWFNSDWRQNVSRLGITDMSVVPALNELFHEVYDPYIQVFPWVEEIVVQLSRRTPVAMLSSSMASSVLRSLGEIAENFSLVLGCEHVTRLKPHPEGIHRILEQCGATPEETWMIGDADVDILAGKNAGTRTAVVTWGLTDSLTELMALDADRIIEKPEDLLSLF